MNRIKSLLGILIVSCFVLHAKSQTSNQDSLLYNKTKAEFVQFEREHGDYIETNNVKMHYLSWGNPKGIPFLWLHGTYSNGYEFYAYAESLVKLGYYVMAIDYYGHGLTPIPTKEVSIYHVADDIKFLLDNLKIKKIIVGGFSRGGSIATAFYDAYPDMVSGIILEDGGSVAWATMEHRESIDSISTKIKSDFREFEKMQNREFRSEFEAVNLLSDLKNTGRVFLTLAAIKQNASAKWIENPGLEKLLGESSATEFLGIYYRPFASSQLFGTSTSLLYPKIIYRNLTVPLLILDPVSENDRFKFEAENSKLQKSHPLLITHKIYENTSHGLKFQRPKEFIEDIISFLSVVKVFNSRR